MGFIKGLRVAKEQFGQAMAAAQSGSVAQPSEEALAALTPAQRAAYDKQMADAQAAIAESQGELNQIYDAQMQGRVLQGPAGIYVYGQDPRDIAAQQAKAMEGGFAEYMKTSWKATSPSASGRQAMPEVQPVSPDRDTQAQHEWNQRERARAPYLAHQRFPVLFTRIHSRSKDQAEAVASHLAESGLAGRPQLVFGAYQVPDLIGLTRGKRRYVEWDIVHAAPSPLPRATKPTSVSLNASDQWVARTSGEPSVLDEDLAIALLHAAQVGPERCLGIARAVTMTVESTGGGECDSGTSKVMAGVGGVQTYLTADTNALPVAQQMADARPIVLAAGNPPGTHIEVLNWAAITRAVQPRTGSPFLVPSPFPYLPSTPQELLRAYIDIVGVNPFDCYSAQVTVQQERDVRDVGSGRVVVSSKTYGSSQPSIDGKARSRLNGASVVVIAYRDRSDYETGRQRWADYERDVLQARLGLGTGAREPVTPMEFGSLGKAARRLLKASLAVADFFDDADTAEASVPHRYCWPPTDAR